jgi:hypothetical protein
MKKETSIKIFETHSRLLLVAKFSNGDNLRFYISNNGSNLSAESNTDKEISQIDLNVIRLKIKDFYHTHISMSNHEWFNALKSEFEKFISVHSLAEKGFN